MQRTSTGCRVASVSEQKVFEVLLQKKVLTKNVSANTLNSLK